MHAILPINVISTGVGSVSRNRARQRAALAGVLKRIIVDGRSLDREFAELAETLEPNARPRARATLSGTVRWYGYLVLLVEQMTGKPAAKLPDVPRMLLVAALYQLWDMRIAPHAVVKETVDATVAAGHPRLKGLVNALLRRYQRESESLHATLDVEPALASMPVWWVDQLRKDWPNQVDEIITASQARAPMWLRVNAKHRSVEQYITELAEALPDLSATASHIASDAVLLDQPVDVHRLPLWDQGAISVQDAAAQLTVDFVAPRPGERILDACAAPGGKAAHMLERTGGDIDLTALDVDKARLQQVAATLERIGHTATLLEADASQPDTWWDGKRYDRILIDAPCSASGVIRRHPDIKFTRRPTDLAALARTQSDLLKSLWPLLATGGRMIYTTCSVFCAENDVVLNEFLREHSNATAKIQLPNAGWEALMVPRGVGYQVLPGTEQFDGFFYGCIEKRQ